ncbi:hypothetical protein [Allobaculum sp. JKK-2023]|nr:hypothetical protein [Allobaculum sp. JKK-2023]
MNVKSRTNGKTEDTLTTSDTTIFQTGTQTVSGTRTHLPKIEKKAKTTPHTAAFTGVIANLSVLFASVGAGVLSLIGLHRNKNRKNHSQY